MRLGQQCVGARRDAQVRPEWEQIPEEDVAVAAFEPKNRLTIDRRCGGEPFLTEVLMLAKQPEVDANIDMVAVRIHSLFVLLSVTIFPT